MSIRLWPYFQCLCLCLALLFCCAPAASADAPSGLILLKTAGPVVNMPARQAVQAQSEEEADAVERREQVALPQPMVFVAEPWIIRHAEEQSQWYRLVAVLDARGEVRSLAASGVRELGPWFTAYVEATQAQPVDFGAALDGRTLPDGAGVQAGMAQLAYGMGYAGVDTSMAAQRRMAEERSLKMAFFVSEYKDARATLFTQATGNESRPWPTAYDDLAGPGEWIVAHYQPRPARSLAVDMSHGGTAWLAPQEKDVKVEIDTTDGAPWVQAWQFTLALGANVDEILRRFGGTVTARTAQPGKWRIDTVTEIQADGLKVTYTDYRNLRVSLSRAGAGLGGVFIGADWCNQQWIERTFSHGAEVEKGTTPAGEQHWVISGGIDGWQYTLELTFDARGLVRQMDYACEDVDLS